jgi:hypothetical protein
MAIFENKILENMDCSFYCLLGARACLVHRQRTVGSVRSALAMEAHCLRRLICQSERRSPASLATRLLPELSPSERVFLGKTVGRRRLARILAVHSQPGLDRIQARNQRVDEPVLVRIGRLREVAARRLRWRAGTMLKANSAYNCFFAAPAQA